MTEFLPVAFPGSVLHNQSHGAVVITQDRYFNTRKFSSVTNYDDEILIATDFLRAQSIPVVIVFPAESTVHITEDCPKAINVT
jgi:hypothetical protein